MRSDCQSMDLNSGALDLRLVRLSYNFKFHFETVRSPSDIILQVVHN